jgi:hypothetical protein
MDALSGQCIAFELEATPGKCATTFGSELRVFKELNHFTPRRKMK